MPLQTIDAGPAFAQKAADVIVGIMRTAIRQHGSCTVGLSGGSTPKPIYEALSKEAIDWSRVTFFLVDDRCVSPDHPDSNQQLARTSIINATGAATVFPDTSLPPEESARDYGLRLKQLWQNRLPDIMMLGMGPDGHIASLFPPLAPHLMDDTRLVAHTTTDTFAVHDRITLTLNPIAAAEHHVFLLKGEDKKRLWDEMMASAENEERWPAKRIVEHGKVTVIFG